MTAFAFHIMCLCTHADSAHPLRDCKAYVSSDEVPWRCECGQYADQHHCTECECREFWSDEMERVTQFGRQRGEIRTIDGVRKRIPV